MKPVDLETPTCPLCGHADSILMYAGKHFKPYGVRCCACCGMSFLSPRPTEQSMMSLYQQDNYFSGLAQGYSNYSDQELALRATFRRLFDYLAMRGKTGGALLDIGCGYGYLLDEARPYFRHRVGTDFSAGAVERARMCADEVYNGGIDAIGEAEAFDCIIASHVIEHVYNPHDFIYGILKLLRPGGSMVIATPDMGSLWRKLMGNSWPSFKLPEHILYFESHSLSRLLTHCGVCDVEVVPYSHAFPIPLIAEKFGVHLPSFLNRYNIWLPATTVACMGVKYD